MYIIQFLFMIQNKITSVFMNFSINDYFTQKWITTDGSQ